MAIFKAWATAVLSAAVVAALYRNDSVIAPCDSPIYCYGELLQEIELARPFADSKTFVDMPTTRPLEEVLAAFNQLPKPVTNNTDLQNFLSTYFAPAGGELAEVPSGELQTNPQFLDNVNDTIVADFVREVIAIWPDLTRRYVGSTNCSGCVDSFLDLNRTFVVAGGRFREPYYWDSFWIVEGLLRTQGTFTQIARNIIENFLDFVEDFGFVPNGARVYYLNRSQPPLLAQMVAVYVEYTNDTQILARALPLLEKEHDFWQINRTVSVNTPSGSYELNRYAVENNQPRPESFREDWVTANNASYYSASGIIYPEVEALNETEKAALYANLASGAESGWDYSSRWMRTPNDAAQDVYFPLRSLNVMKTVPVDLNSILYANEITIAELHNITGNSSASTQWAQIAETRQKAMYEIMWNSTYNSYFDYNLTSNAQNVYMVADENASPLETAGAPPGLQVAFFPSQYYPFWTGAAPDELKANPLAVKLAYSRVAELLRLKAGGIAASNLVTGQQWDEPNVWPPLMYILIKGLHNTPPTFGADDDSYVWTQDTALALAQRYLDSTFCTWRATGGSTPGLAQLQGAAGNGTMFEKYADNATNRVGAGGEYQVVEGFGWTNGVLIWIADVFGQQLKQPDCGNIMAAMPSSGARKAKRWQVPSAVEIHQWDKKWVKDFRR